MTSTEFNARLQAARDALALAQNTRTNLLTLEEDGILRLI